MFDPTTNNKSDGDCFWGWHYKGGSSPILQNSLKLSSAPEAQEEQGKWETLIVFLTQILNILMNSKPN